MIDLRNPGHPPASGLAPGITQDAFIDHVLELFGPFGTIVPRRMFSGYGVFLDGLMFALIVDEALYLKVDEINRDEFERVGCEPFAYLRRGRETRLSFHRAPAEAMDCAEAMLPWARSAYAAALRSRAKKLAPRPVAARRRRTAR